MRLMTITEIFEEYPEAYFSDSGHLHIPEAEISIIPSLFAVLGTDIPKEFESKLNKISK